MNNENIAQLSELLPERNVYVRLMVGAMIQHVSALLTLMLFPEIGILGSALVGLWVSALPLFGMARTSWLYAVCAFAVYAASSMPLSRVWAYLLEQTLGLSAVFSI